MSRLITSGDTIANFGELLPTPYIEQIYISTDVDGGTGYGTIDVKLNIYLNAPVEADDEAIINGILKYSVYWHVLSTDTNASADSSSLVSDTDEAQWSIDGLINGDYNIWSIGYTGECAGWEGDRFQISDLISADETLPEYEVVYDDAGNRLLKIAYDSIVAEETLVLGTPSCGTTLFGGVTWGDTDEDYEVGETLVTAYDYDLYLFAWAAAPGHRFTAAGLRPPDGFDLPSDDYASDDDADYNDRWGTFLDLQTSDVAYDVVWSNGAAGSGEESIWVDESGAAFDGTPLQSVSGQYYSADVISHSEIVSSFEELLEGYEDLKEADLALEDVMADISYILRKYKESANLLVELNLLSRAFPNKSSVTNVGSLYIQYRDKISAANTVIETATPLYEKIVNNTKVIDLRSLEFEWADVGDDGARREDGGVLLDDDTYMTTNMKLGRTSFYSDGTQYWNNYGFVFFDYDKALYETAAIGEYFSMNGLFNIFGREFLNKYFRLYRGIYVKFDDDWNEHYRIIGRFSDDDDASVGYKQSGITYEVADSDNAGEIYIYDDTTNELAYSFVFLRNFQLAKEGGLGGYRLMGFEFQDLRAAKDALETGGGAAQEDHQTRFSIQVRDYSLGLVGELISAYETAQEGLDDYVEEALEACAYNTIDARWKDSFVKTMHAKYDGDIGTAPWVFYPVYYCLHQDLLTKEFAGDMALLMAAAAKISDRINPDYGTQEELEQFKTNFDELYDTFYSNSAAEVSSVGNLSDVAENYGTDDYTVRYYYTTWDNSELDDLVYEYASEDEDGNAVPLSDVAAYVEPNGTAALAASSAEVDPTSYDPYSTEEEVSTSSVLWVYYADHGYDESDGIFMDGTVLESGDYVDRFFNLIDADGNEVSFQVIYIQSTTAAVFMVKPYSDLEGGTWHYLSSAFVGRLTQSEAGGSSDTLAEWGPISFRTEE